MRGDTLARTPIAVVTVLCSSNGELGVRDMPLLVHEVYPFLELILHMEQAEFYPKANVRISRVLFFVLSGI